TALFIVVFFFQAEDGIRDRNVTGVQTCALPISPTKAAEWPTRSALQPSFVTRAFTGSSSSAEAAGWLARSPPLALFATRPAHCRSEERRVGKECSSRCSGCQESRRLG